MELYEIKEKVGSDPCLVLDFDFNVETDLNAEMVIFESILKEFSTDEEAMTFKNGFVELIESLTKTRLVSFRIIGHTTDPLLSNVNNSVMITSNLFFGTGTNADFGRGIEVIADLPGPDIKRVPIDIYVFEGKVFLQGRTSIIERND